MSDIKEIQDPMSIKQIFQQMVPEAMEIIQGRVTSVSPLAIQAINDDKLTLTGNILCVPRHLSTYQTTVDISVGAGGISSSTGNGFPSSVEEHTHSLTTFNVRSASMTVYNGLKVGDIVYILSFNHGKKYYVIDREAN